MDGSEEETMSEQTETWHWEGNSLKGPGEDYYDDDAAGFKEYVAEQLNKNHDAARQRDKDWADYRRIWYEKDTTIQELTRQRDELQQRVDELQDKLRPIADVKKERDDFMEAIRLLRPHVEELERQRDLAVRALRKIKAAPWHGDPLKRIVEHEAMILCAEEALDAIAKPGGD